MYKRVVKEKIVPFIFIAPINSHVTNVFVYNLHITIFSRVYSHVTRVYSYEPLTRDIENPMTESKFHISLF